MQFYYNYIIESEKNKTLYKGCTNNLIRRLKEHNSGLMDATKLQRPWKLIYYEACLNKKDAYNREKYLKMGGGRRFVEKRLEHYFSSALPARSLRSGG